MQKRCDGGGRETEREREYKYIVDFVWWSRRERASTATASRQTWSKSINSKTVFMSAVTSLQIFDNIQLINPNIALPFCTSCLYFLCGSKPRSLSAVASILSICWYPLQHYQLHVYPKIANVVRIQIALNQCDCLNSGITILQIQISNIFDLNIN